MIPIGRVAHVTGLSVKAIKFYEARGLVRPTRTKNQYRMYGMEEIRRLSEIKRLRQIGLRLEQIQSGLPVDTLLETRLDEVQAEIERLHRIERQIRLIQSGGNDMKIRYEMLNEAISVYGYGGTLEEIPNMWAKLQPELTTDESYGVCLPQENGYVAGMTKPVSGESARSVELTKGNYIVATVEGGIPMIPSTYEQLVNVPDVTLRDAVDFERYIHGQGGADDIIEIWMPIE
ncbi:MerR family transcriptional regulator [Exiguobacterium sp. KJ 601]|uniref:MerR family transcriptional regulator n=1 Tax=Exiguobacterium sp. KJ 601 TaxID=2782569 RepID=UPI0022AEBEDE|nr:MerR family transcriptional regulator [Exiguobacterium sp. KJ 601]